MMREGRKRQQAGQAATEFVIAAVFLLVPLFLIIPLLGKYIDIKHAAIGQARYSAWEYTVWRSYDPGLYFGDPNHADYGNPIKTAPLNPLWRDHRGTPLFALEDTSAPPLDTRTPMPFGIIGKFAGGFLEFVGYVFGRFGDLLKRLHVDGNADFLNVHGYYVSDISLQVRPLDQILPRWAPGGASPDDQACLKNPNKDNCLAIRARAAVLTDDWNARNPEHADRRSRGMVPTAVLSPLSSLIDGVIQPINKGLSRIPGFDIKLPGVPQFGYVKDDLIPYEHRYDTTMKLQEKQGLSSYEKQ